MVMHVYVCTCIVQLKCNLMPAHESPGENTQMNLQTGMGKISGACNGHYQPGNELMAPVNILALTII